MVLKDERYNEIDRWYNDKLSVKENLKIAKGNNVKVSMDTLYRYCEERNIHSNPDNSYSEAFVLSLYDET